jgi:hypothetical protein
MSILEDLIVDEHEELIDVSKFPPKVYVLAFTNGTYGGYFFRRDNIHGIACFSTANKALRFSEHISSTGAVPTEMTFDEAVEVVIIRRRYVPQLRCLFLMDGDFDHPTATFWV